VIVSAIFARAAREWALMRSEYGDYLEAHIAAAYEVTNGVLLNARGRAAHVNESRLFTAGATYATAYASRELLDFWATTPRLSVAEFERAWAERLDAEPDQRPADDGEGVTPHHWPAAA
jgi:hypothetical protein